VPSPVANISAVPTVGSPPRPVSFSASASTADTAITDWLWDFGDGSAIVSSSGPQTEHTYLSVGTYTVILTIRDSDDNESSTSIVITVTEQSVPTVVSPSVALSTEVWYNYVAFAEEHSISYDDAISALREATYILTELTQGEVHGERCYRDTYRRPHRSQLDLAHGPVASVASVVRSHACGDEETEVEFCLVTDRAIDLGCSDLTGSPYGSELRLPGCGCKPIQFTVEYTQASTLVAGSDRVARKLASEYIKAQSGKPCDLPERITSVTRQGMSWTILDPQDFLSDGLTGISQIDQWIAVARRRGSGLKVRDPLRGVLLRSEQIDCETGSGGGGGGGGSTGHIDGGTPDSAW
jgi:hypothetical protein